MFISLDTDDAATQERRKCLSERIASNSARVREFVRDKVIIRFQSFSNSIILA